MLLESPTAPFIQKSRVFTEPTMVESRLRGVDPTLSENILLESNMRGYAARLEATPAHAPTAAGTYHWHTYVASLRLALTQQGWTSKDHKNCPFIISPDQKVMILVMTGDSDTGTEFGNPRNQADKGAVLSEAVLQNKQYELFENAALTALQRGDTGTQLWVLLYHVERDYSDPKQIRDKEIRTELSLPTSFEKRKIVGWSERIILRSMPLDVHPEPEYIAPTEPIDVPVERRRSGT